MSDDYDDSVPDEAPEEEAVTQDEAEEAEPAEPEEGDDTSDDDAADDEEEAKKPKPNSVKKSIDRLTRQRTAAERERDYWREIALQGQRGQQPQQTPAQQAPAKEPDINDFDSDQDYYKALVKFELSQERAQAQQSQSTARQQQDLSERQARFNDGIADVLEKYPDFEEVVRDPDLPLGPELAQLILETDNAHDVAYHVATHDKVLRELSQLSPARAALKLGQISARLAAPASAPKSTTKAPKPPPTVKAKGSSPNKDPSQMSDAEYAKWRQGGGGE